MECECCGVAEVELLRCPVMGAECICRTCIQTWYKSGLTDADELAKASLMVQGRIYDIPGTDEWKFARWQETWGEK